MVWKLRVMAKRAVLRFFYFDDEKHGLMWGLGSGFYAAHAGALHLCRGEVFVEAGVGASGPA